MRLDYVEDRQYSFQTNIIAVYLHIIKGSPRGPETRITSNHRTCRSLKIHELPNCYREERLN